MNAEQAWQSVLGQLQMEMPRASFDTWVRDTRPVAFNNGMITVGVRNAYARDWLESRLSSTVNRLLIGILDSNVAVSFVVSQPDDHDSKSDLEPVPASTDFSVPEPLARNPTINPRYTFETYVVGSGNRLAHAACLAVAEKPARAYNPLFVYGGVGLGKTHLLHAVANACHARGLTVLYVSSEEFTNDMINAIRTHATQAFREKYRSADVLLVDDIQFIAGKESTQEEFFHTFNDLYNSSKQIVLTSDSIPKEIPGLEERLRSRFEWGLIADIQAPDLETKAAILRKKAQAEGVQIPDEVSLFIASNVKSNVRELEGYLVRIVAYASLTNQAITLDLAREILKEFMNGDRAITIPRILEVVSDFYRLKEKELLSKSRHKSIVLPRQVAMYLCRTQTNASLPDIGAEFGGKDHSTVMYACDKVLESIGSDSDVARQINSIKASLGK